jgi:hypothetical protein
MDNAEAEILGRFRANVAGASLERLAPIVASSLDDLIQLARLVDRSNLGVEMAAALSAELHKRFAPHGPVAPVVGNA